MASVEEEIVSTQPLPAAAPPADTAPGPHAKTDPGRSVPVNPLLHPLSLKDWLLIAGAAVLFCAYVGGVLLCVRWVARWIFGG